MKRRCISESCLLTAARKSSFLNLPVASVLVNPLQDWQRIAYRGGRIAHKLDLDGLKLEDFLWTHCSICCSVETEDNGYYIKPSCSELVNNNGNAWTNPVLLACFRSFIGAENYQEHIQIKSLSKGKVVDAVIRPVVHKSKFGDAHIYFVDILVATNRKHTNLVKDISSGKLNTLSMGCTASIVVCSRCGRELSDDENCEHLDNQMLRTFKDENGVERIIAELCGRSYIKNGERVGDPDSMKFIEASWVRRPAFAGAVLNYFLKDIPKTASVLAMPDKDLESMMDNIFQLRVADTEGMLALKVARWELSKRRRIAVMKSRRS